MKLVTLKSVRAELFRLVDKKGVHGISTGFAHGATFFFQFDIFKP